VKRFTDAAALLHDLLDRFEARPEASRWLTYLDDEGFRNIAEQDACLERLAVVQRAGGVLISRRLVDGVDSIFHVRLTNPQVVYSQLNRTPAPHTPLSALERLNARGDLPEAIKLALEEVSRAWSRNVQALGLTPGASADLEAAVEFALALDRRMAGPSLPQVDYRSFSRAICADSKALERLLRAVGDLTRRQRPDLFMDGLGAADILAVCGVVRLPQPFLASGPLVLDGRPLPQTAYSGIPVEDAVRLQIAAPVSYVLTIENFASFVRHAREINATGNGLVIYSGGFPSALGLQAIVALAEHGCAPVFHWGDLDAGGLRIFMHIERALRGRALGLQPHLMDIDLLRTRGEQPGKGRLRMSPGGAQGSVVEALWDAMAQAGLALEQEAVAPTPPRL
jgi:hypothetical protein